MGINDRIKKIRSDYNMIQEDFAESIGTSRSNLAQIERGKSLPSLQIIATIVNKFHTTYEYLIDGKSRDIGQGSAMKSTSIKHEHQGVNEDKAEYKVKESIMVVTQDSAGNDTIPIVNIRAAANYLTGYESQEYIQELDYVSMPQWMLKSSGLYRFFTVTGDSMEPTLHDGQYILSRRLEVSEYDDMVDLNVYVIVANGLHHSGIYIKRVKNRFQDHGFLRCRSDNRAHSPFNLYFDEIVEIWKVEWYFTSYFPNLNENLFDKIESLQHRIEDLEINLKKK